MVAVAASIFDVNGIAASCNWKVSLLEPEHQIAAERDYRSIPERHQDGETTWSHECYELEIRESQGLVSGFLGVPLDHPWANGVDIKSSVVVTSVTRCRGGRRVWIGFNTSHANDAKRMRCAGAEEQVPVNLYTLYMLYVLIQDAKTAQYRVTRCAASRKGTKADAKV
jgi:hypothetical protein